MEIKKKEKTVCPNINKNKPVKGSELKAGDVLQFLDVGEWKEVDFSQAKDGSKKKEVCEFQVSINGEDPRTFCINATSSNNLAPRWGGNTENWLKKKAKVGFVKMSVGGKLVDALCLEAIDE